MRNWKKVNLMWGDGYYGWKQFAPYDGIIVTCAADMEIPPPLMDQIKLGGTFIVPVTVKENGEQV